MKVALRAALVGVALLAIVAGGATSVYAASPTPAPTVGGALSAGDHILLVTSHGNEPAHVVMTSNSVVISDTAFDLLPGESKQLTFTGPMSGQVEATFAGLTIGQTGSASLVVNLRPTPVPQPSPQLPVLPLAVVILALLGVARLRPWQWRLTRVQS